MWGGGGGGAPNLLDGAAAEAKVLAILLVVARRKVPLSISWVMGEAETEAEDECAPIALTHHVRGGSAAAGLAGQKAQQTP